MANDPSTEKKLAAQCTIERVFTDLGAALQHAKTETLARGGTWEGDLKSGSYKMRTPLGPIEGSYTVLRKTVRFTIQHKPMLVPCSLIARIIDQFIAT